MPTESIELSRVFPATPLEIFAAWLDAALHAAMTGGPATVESTEVGGRFSAWGGYIDGSHVALEPGRRILQSWRSDDFPADAVDSLLEVRLEPVRGGTRVTIRHSDLPVGQGVSYRQGWEQHYLDPMERYFGKAARRGPARKRAEARRKGSPERKAAPGTTVASRKTPAAPRAPPRRKKAGAPGTRPRKASTRKVVPLRQVRRVKRRTGRS
jgi:uncharacterized protein YndB with AHSA1/START domain